MTRPKGRFYKRKPGGQPKHAYYSIVHKQEFVEAHPEVFNYGKDFFEAMLAELSQGGRRPTAGELLLLDRLHAQVITVALIDSYVARSGVLRHDLLQQKPPVLAPWPIMELWMSLNRSIQSGLLALGLEAKRAEPLVLSPFELAAEVVKDAEREERKKGSVPGPEEEERQRPGSQDPAQCIETGLSGATAAASEGEGGGGGPEGQGRESSGGKR